MRTHLKRLFLSVFTVVLLMPTQIVHASNGAVSDILMDPRFEGAIDSIQNITNAVDLWFVRIITFCAFFIISMAILKNVMAGVYCAFPKFFRAVHEAHEQTKFLEMVGGILANPKGIRQTGAQSWSSLVSNPKNTLLALVPDVMAFTDFADQEVAPKTYFMKAIPQMCILVIMGIFIYNGYYRNLAATVGETGATIFTTALASVDPNAMVEYATGMTSEPTSSYKRDKTIQGEYIYTLSQAMYKTLRSNSQLASQSKDVKEQILRACESAAYKLVTGTDTGLSISGSVGGEASGLDDNTFKAEEGYVYKLTNVNVVLASENMTGTSYTSTDTTDQSKAFRWITKVDSIMGNSANVEATLNGRYLVVTGNLIPTAKDENKTYEAQFVPDDYTVAAGDLGISSVTLQISLASVGQPSNGKYTINIKDFNQQIVNLLSSSVGSGIVIDESSIRCYGGSGNGTTLSDAVYHISGGAATKVGTIKFKYTKSISEDGSTTTSTGSGTIDFLIELIN